MTRGERRHHAIRIKAKTKKTLKYMWGMDPPELTPRRIGKTAAMHGTCPCWMCTEPHHAPDHPKNVFQPKLHA